MMVPRAYAAAPFGSSPPPEFDEKQKSVRQTRPKEIPRRKKSSHLSSSPPRTRSPSSFDSNPSTSPTPASSTRPRLQPARPAATTTLQNETSRPKPIRQPLRRRQSAQDILAATAIPIRRKPRQNPRQRLPNGDHVVDFSRLLLDDVKPGSNGSLSNSLGNPQFDALFGHIDELVEDEMIVGSNGLDAGILTTRSISTESIMSLASPDDFSSADNETSSPSVARWNSDRKVRQLAVSENCEEEHPLMHLEREEPAPPLSITPPPRKLTPRERKPSAFTSSLTASLKAIKSAAQSVSNYASAASIQPDDFFSHSIFDIQPSMTDDRRPPPLNEPPSPAMRRYLNPDYSSHPDSPAQLHFWLDHRSASGTSQSHQSKSSDAITPFKPKIKKKYLKGESKSSSDSSRRPPLVPLATCIPPAVRTAHASSPPIWLAPDGTPSNRHTATHSTGSSNEAGAAFGGLKQREPRENRDFLRVLVCEMEMRRHGKLDEAAEGRARLWLPPIEEKSGGKAENGKVDQYTADSRKDRRTGGERWKGVSANEL